MSKQKLEIHSENILPIIKKWLYSDHDIFVRELVSNACDALYKVKLLRDQGQAQAKDEEFKIEIKIDKEKKTLTFVDTGVGMDHDEVVKYIAQIAFSGAEDFVNKYQESGEKDPFIGHFGLGFYSAYMVSDKVEINTLSYKEGAEPVFWSCDGSSEYDIDKGTKAERGTEITLHINGDSEEFLEEARLKNILSEYCSFLPYPIHLGETHINDKEPLWIKPASECTDEDYLSFYRSLYPMEEDPLFWVHLNVDYPFHLQGILFFPKVRRDFDMQKSAVKLFCNRVFVSDNCKDVIPSYLTVLRGVIDSPDIPLNVSRSYLQTDRTVRQLSTHITKKVADSLSSLYKTDRERFIKCWDDISVIIKLGMLEDEKFYERVKDFLVWKTTDEEWLTAAEYIERYGEKIIYTRDAHHHTHMIEMYKEKGVAVLVAGSPIDNYVMQFLERKHSPAAFQRIDGGMDDKLLDKERENSVLDADGKTESSKLADFFRSKLGSEGLEVEAKSLASDAVPAFVMIDEGQRRMQEYMMSMDPKGQFPQMGKKTFVVNTNNPLINSLKKLDGVNPELAQEMCKEVYDLALLSQREIDPKDLNAFITRSNSVLAKLTEQALGNS